MNLINELTGVWAIAPTAVPFLTSTLNAKTSAPPGRSSLAPVEELEIVGSTAIIRMVGVMLRTADEFLQGLGFCSCETVTEQLEQAASDPNVRQILLVANSPGGQISGAVELANRVVEINRAKPVEAYIEGMGASACYWVLSGCRQILAQPSATVGSIAVLMVHVDQTAAQEAAGYRVEIFRSGPLKAVGALGEKLTDPQRQHIHTQLADAFDLFKSHLATHRPKLSPAVMDGATFLAIKAAGLNLIDGVRHSLRAVLNGAVAAGSPQTARSTPTAMESYARAVKKGHVRIHERKAGPAVASEFTTAEAFRNYQRALEAGHVVE